MSVSQKPITRRGCLTILFSSILLFVILVIGLSTGYLMALLHWKTKPLPGKANAFEVSGHFSEIREYAGKDVQLESIRIEYVRSDGTIDFYPKYRPKAIFTFVKGKSTKDAHLGAPGDYSNMKRITITAERPWTRSVVTSTHYRHSYVNRGLHKETSKVYSEPVLVPMPSCTIEELWDKAVGQGVPRNAVATITYDKNGYGFTIDEVAMLYFDSDCQIK